jgi:hypothetical protein
MSVSRSVTPSGIYRSIAEECRTKAQSFRSQKARQQMLQNAADYEKKARLAETYEVAEKECAATLWVGTVYEDAD